MIFLLSKWKQSYHGNIKILQNLDLLAFSDDVLFADSEDGLQRSVLQLQDI